MVIVDESATKTVFEPPTVNVSCEKVANTTWFLELYTTVQAFTVCEVGRLLVQLTLTPVKPLFTSWTGGVGGLNDVLVGTEIVTVIDFAVAVLPAKSLAFNVMVQWPVGRPEIVTVYVTELPGVLVPVTDIDDAVIAVPFLVAVILVVVFAFKSPSASVIVAATDETWRDAPFAVVKTIVGADVSTRTWYAEPTTVFDLASVALNWIVEMPAGRLAETTQVNGFAVPLGSVDESATKTVFEPPTVNVS